ncbi:alkaline phosphatase family protein [Microbacterium kribbense]|uniref:Alkaline phosphatase family protein n=2 Tax=Microbacterium kribbense TaxID=433645 RepID=A0ABP7GVC8_9MICO
MAAVLMLAGCAASPHPQPSGPQPSGPLPAHTTPTAPAPTETSATASQPLSHVVIIVEENKPASSIIGNPSAPYLNALAREFASATDDNAITHPSLPNYLALTGGTTAGITTDCNPEGSCLARVPSITTEIERSGRTWKMYAEGMPSPCDAHNSGRYAVRHNPFLYYPSITDDAPYCAAHNVPLTRLAADLASTATMPDYAFISPDLCDDMHDCSIATGDRWLSRQVPAILSSPAFASGRSLLVVTFDEGDRTSNTVPLIFAGSAAKRGYRSDRGYTHYSLLRTIEREWGLAPLTGNDAAATPMTDLLR